MARKNKVEMPRPELNITAMMDLVLNLLMFFVLVSNFSEASLPPLKVPTPDTSLAKPGNAPNKVVLNVLAGKSNSGEALAVKFGTTELPPGDYTSLTLMLQKEYKISKDVQIDLRADQTLRYDQVQPVMNAITSAGISKINIVAQGQ